MKHMETLAEFCSILRVEILQDHVQHNGIFISHKLILIFLYVLNYFLHFSFS